MTQHVLSVLFLCWVACVSGQETLPSVSVRLRGGLNDREGRVEILYQGNWGTICDDGWDARDSGVICRMLGFVGVSRAHNGSYFPPGAATQPVLLDDVNCDGDEATIAACKHNGWTVTNCAHIEDAGVTCLGERFSTTTTTTPGPTTTTAPPRICDNPSTEVRLVNPDSSTPWEGRVQVDLGGTWYEVCDDSWDLADAQVVCRMLCYNPANARPHLGPTYGNITETFLLDNVLCTGDEDHILNCTANPDFQHNCGYNEGAGVSCMPDEPAPVPAPDPEILCADELITARFPQSADTLLRPEHLTLVNRSGCGYTTDMDSTYVYIRIPFIGCDTTREINGTHIIYTNVFHYEVPPPDPDITRLQSYDIPASCVMDRNDDLDNAVESETQTVPPQYGNGHFEVDMYIYRTTAFRERIMAFPAEILLGDWVIVGLSITSSDPRLKVVVPRCYTTPTADPASTPQYFLIQDKCAVDSSVEYHPVNQTLFGFRFRSFKFQNSSSVVYLHCKAYVCGEEEKDARCDRSCAETGGRRRRRRDVTRQHSGGEYEIVFPNHTVFSRDRGPFVIRDQPTTTTTVLPTDRTSSSRLPPALSSTTTGVMIEEDPAEPLPPTPHKDPVMSSGSLHVLDLLSSVLLLLAAVVIL